MTDVIIVMGIRIQNHKCNEVQESRCALRRRANVLIIFVVHVISANLELQVGLLKVSRFSIGWFLLESRLVSAHLEFCTSWGQTRWFFSILRVCSIRQNYIVLLSAQCVSSIEQIIKSVCVSVSQSVSEWVSVKFGTPSISRKRLKQKTSNLAHRLATAGPNEKM